MKLLLVCIGGAAGSLLRYGCSRLWQQPGFPFSTLLVNVAGCFIIGMLWALLSTDSDATKRLLLITGFCGGFTTFSTFSLEGLQMLQQARFYMFFLYTFASVFCGLTATYIGFKLFTS